MVEPIPHPKTISWTRAYRSGEWVATGIPSFDHDACEQEKLLAWDNRFAVSLGSYSFSGDATGIERAQQAAEVAFRALIDCNNVMSGCAWPALPPLVAGLELLSPRERNVVDLLCSGLRLSSAAEVLHISNHTARNHLKNAFRKLGVHSQNELIAKYGRPANG